jgi:2'-5' RNA ligase
MPCKAAPVARRRFGVALVLPSGAGAELDVLRRACGADDLDRIPAHITLVPPINVAAADVDAALDAVSSSAVRSRPMRFTLGPIATFLPANPVAYAVVRGDLEALRSLRDDVFVPPLHRDVSYDFVPHATVVIGVAEDRLAAIVKGLADWRIDIDIDRVHLLEERRDDDGVVRWRPIADAPLGMQGASRGTGGIAVTTLEAERWPSPHRAFSVRANVDGRLAGTAHGWVVGEEAWLDALQVDEGVRGIGVGRHLLTEVVLASARRGASTIAARHHPFLTHHGWGPPGFSPIVRRSTQ